MKGCCKNCEYLGTLWDWENYPYNKTYKHCCTVFSMDKDDKVAMVLYGDIENNICEMFVEKKGDTE